MNKSIHKNKYRIPSTEMLIDSISQHLKNTQNGQQANFSTKDLKYAFSQLQLHKDIAKHCNYNIICGESTVTYGLKTGFYGPSDMPADFQTAMGYTLVGLQTPIVSLTILLLLAQDQKPITSVMSLNALKNNTMTT